MTTLMMMLRVIGLLAVAILSSAIPLFYDFDFNEIYPIQSFWGIVDNFQDGIAAMTTAGFLETPEDAIDSLGRNAGYSPDTTKCFLKRIEKMKEF